MATMSCRCSAAVVDGNAQAHYFCSNGKRKRDCQRDLTMSVQALGYVGLRAKELGDWAKFGSDFLGLQRIDKTRHTMAFRMDDRKQRVVIDADGGQGIGFFGWEVADAAAMEALAGKLEPAGVKVARGSRALADERHVK